MTERCIFTSPVKPWQEVSGKGYTEKVFPIESIRVVPGNVQQEIGREIPVGLWCTAVIENWGWSFNSREVRR